MKNLADFFSGLRDHHAEGSETEDEAADLCINCGAALTDSELYAQFGVCPACRFHATIGAPQRIAMLVDPGSFREMQRNLVSIDPLSFAGQASYRRRIFDEQRRTGLTDAIVTGTAAIQGEPVVLAVIDFRFLGGSLGCVVGERLASALEHAARRKLPVIAVVASGGIRLQEGLLSLAQVAKTVVAAERLAAARQPLISVLANPTIGAAYAGFVGMSDVIVAEPGAIIGYATTRALEESSGGHLPPGAHTAEAQLQHGLVDQIVDRERQRDFLAALLAMLSPAFRLTATRTVERETVPAERPAAWKTLEIARHAHRPTAVEYIGHMSTSFIELHGDRIEGDDPAIVCGFGQLGGESVIFIGQEREGGRAARVRPQGFRKARRAMQLAAKLDLPLISLIDTAGAAGDLAAEEHGLGDAMASCLATAATLPVPTIAVIVGEGGSEAALAFGVANRLLMMENAIFQPMAPEIAASILYRDSGRADDAAAALRITAADCVRLGVADGIVPEPVGGAHSSHEEAARELKQVLLQELTAIQTEKGSALVKQRYRKLRNVGRYSNYLGERVRQEVGEFGDVLGRRAAALVSRIRHPRTGEDERSDEGLLIP